MRADVTGSPSCPFSKHCCTQRSNSRRVLRPEAADRRSHGPSAGSVDHQAIKRAVDEQLAQKGLTKAEKNADLYVGYQAAVKEEKSVNLSGTGGGPSWWGWEGGAPHTVQGQTSTIPVGTLAVNLYDPGRMQLIWRGDAIKTLDLKKDPDKSYKNLQKAMAKLFKNYPPQVDK